MNRKIVIKTLKRLFRKKYLEARSYLHKSLVSSLGSIVLGAAAANRYFHGQSDDFVIYAGVVSVGMLVLSVSLRILCIRCIENLRSISNELACED